MLKNYTKRYLCTWGFKAAAILDYVYMQHCVPLFSIALWAILYHLLPAFCPGHVVFEMKESTGRVAHAWLHSPELRRALMSGQVSVLEDPGRDELTPQIGDP